MDCETLIKVSDQEISRRPLGIPSLLILLMDDDDASIPGWD